MEIEKTYLIMYSNKWSEGGQKWLSQKPHLWEIEKNRNRSIEIESLQESKMITDQKWTMNLFFQSRRVWIVNQSSLSSA